jgi:hypothetical protein
MMRRTRLVSLLFAGMFCCTSPLDARVMTLRTQGPRSTGARRDISVPYLTTGGSAFMSGYAGPRIYSSPIVNDPLNPGSRPVFNLPFYGARQAFGDRSEGAAPR